MGIAMFVHRLDMSPDPARKIALTGVEQTRIIFESWLCDFPYEVMLAVYLRPDLTIEFFSFFEGGTEAVDANPRKLVRDACVRGTSAILLAHNHPSGDSLASRSDKVWTKHLSLALSAIDVTLLDHIIFASNSEPYSFRQHDLI